jgi:predicted short-subunit dehydrogenase-like oxidoreductase (DUF2520 family)
MSRTPKDISIIGAGVVGTAVASLAQQAAYEVVAVASRSFESARRAAHVLGKGVAVEDPAEAARRGAIVLITTPDDAIATVCEKLARAKAFRPGSVVAHCSGALSSEVLMPAKRECGAAIGSIHPMQTFPTVGIAISHFADTWCYCEGDEAAVAALRELFEAMGGHVEQIGTSGKVLYHAACVMACNYLVALLDAAADLAEAAGIDRARAVTAMHPLVAATVENVARLGCAGALTGPIARGDVETVGRHLEAIARSSPELTDLYALLGHRTLRIAENKGKLSEALVEQLRELLGRANVGVTHDSTSSGR